MRLRTLAAIPTALFLASALGCSGAPGSEAGDSVSSAASTGGVSAALTVTPSGSTYSASMVVTNGSAQPITNWQVVVNMGPKFSDQNHKLIYESYPQPSGATAVNGAYFNDLGNNELFMPMSSTASISAGGSKTITWSGDYNGTKPAIVSVDGVANGTALAGDAADGLDPIALTAATFALRIAYDYEKDKLGNNGDSNYAIYDQTIWSAQSFRVASGNASIEYDPNVPGYAFIPGSVKADLAAAQTDPTVASYLTAGLVSCFQTVDGSMEYGFRADFLKGFTYPTTHSGSITNGDGSVDNFTVSGAPINNGQEVVTIKATSGPSKPDNSFGILRYLSAPATFPSYGQTMYPKFQGSAVNVGSPNPGTYHGHYAAACTPFNGPGGSTNPYFVITQNNASVPAWFQAVGVNCMNGCSGTLVIDPVPYAEPGDYYDTSGNLVGMQSNPFALDITVLYAIPDHATQWATRTANNTQQWGTFSNAVQILGYTEYKYAKQY